MNVGSTENISVLIVVVGKQKQRRNKKMNNDEAIKKQWKPYDDEMYPHLFMWINKLMEVNKDDRNSK